MKASEEKNATLVRIAFVTCGFPYLPRRFPLSLTAKLASLFDTIFAVGFHRCHVGRRFGGTIFKTRDEFC
jgi:hypothetical protein